MTTRTFASKEELMASLLQGEKWGIEGKFAYCYYQTKKANEYSFWVSMRYTEDYEVSHAFPYCDSKTVWHKVEEKTELDLMKEKFASGDYILVIPDCYTEEWFIVQNPHWNCDNYKLIHKKHKDVLDAYLFDSRVDIEVLFDSGYLQQIAGVFIDSYNENWEYRIKPKKKTVSIIKFYSTKGKVLEMDKSKLTQTPKNIIDEYEIEVYDE